MTFPKKFKFQKVFKKVKSIHPCKPQVTLSQNNEQPIENKSKPDEWWSWATPGTFDSMHLIVYLVSISYLLSVYQITNTIWQNSNMQIKFASATYFTLFGFGS